jgi:colanic acid biosynthesis glycosyl transferase WcaI
MKVLLYSLNYAPELIGIGKYSGELAEWLAANQHKMRVICAPPYYPAWQVTDTYKSWRYKSEYLNGVKVLRCPIFVPKKPTTFSRLLHLCSFAISSLPVVLKQTAFKPDVVIVIEPTFFCLPSALLLSKLTGAKSILHIQDFELDAMLGLGMAKLGILSKVFYALEAFLMRRLDAISTISNSMSVKAAEKTQSKVPVHIFRNWVDTDFIKPQSIPNPLYQELGISNDKQIVIYAGNLGKKQGLEMLLDAAQYLANEAVVFLIFGDGAEKEVLQKKAAILKLNNLFFLPLQPYDQIPALMMLGDVHLVLQKKGVADLVMPSKLTTILSAGGHTLITAEPESELGRLCQKYPGIAECVEPENLTQFVNALHKMLSIAKSEKPNTNIIARDYALNKLNKDIVLQNFANILKNLIKKPA